MDANAHENTPLWRYVIGCHSTARSHLQRHCFSLTNQQHHRGGASCFLHGIRCMWSFNHSSNLLPLKCIQAYSWLKRLIVMRLAKGMLSCAEMCRWWGGGEGWWYVAGLVNGSWGITFPNRVAPVPPSLQPKHPFLPKTIQLAFLWDCMID